MTDPAHSIERERLLYITAVQELKLYAAIHGSRIMVTEPELDIEGFDFVVASNFEQIHIQSKATLHPGGAKVWKIRASLVKESFYDRDLMPDMDGQAVGGYSTGATGGVLIHVIDGEAADVDQLKVSYRYLDVFWLIGVAAGMAGHTMRKRKRALDLLRQIRDADEDQKILFRINDFAKLNSVTDVAFLRLHIGGMSNWASRCKSTTDLSLLKASVDQPLSLLWPGRAFVS